MGPGEPENGRESPSKDSYGLERYRRYKNSFYGFSGNWAFIRKVGPLKSTWSLCADFEHLFKMSLRVDVVFSYRGFEFKLCLAGPMCPLSIAVGTGPV